MKKLLFGLVLLMVSASAFAQSREFIRQEIRKQGQCRNVAITEYNGDLMLYGRNGWAVYDCPSSLTTALRELNNDSEYINDVQLTNNGKWLILYGNNGLRWNDIPYSLESMLRKWNADHEEITSVSFNDSGDWIAVSTEHIAASSDAIQDWMAEGMREYGKVWATCITENAIIVVYARGYKFYGDIPYSLERRLDNVDFNVYRIKIAGDAWFISDGVSKNDYNM